MSETPQSDHQRAAAAKAKARAAKKQTKKKPARKRRVREAPLESFPSIDLTAKERKEITQARDLATKADTQAALARPSQLTPLQLKRLAISEALKANRRAKHAPKQPPETN